MFEAGLGSLRKQLCDSWPCSEVGLLSRYSVGLYDTPCEHNTTQNDCAQAEPGCVGGKLSILYVNNKVRQIQNLSNVRKTHPSYVHQSSKE